MPQNDKARFEPQEIVTSQDYAVRENKDRSTAQANETFVLDAKSNRSIGDNGETLAFGKKQFGIDDNVEQARQDAAMQAQMDLAELQQKPGVQQWQQRRAYIDNIDSDLKFANIRLDTAREDLAKGIENGVTGDDLAQLQQDAERRQAEVDRLQNDKQNKPQILQELAAQLQQSPNIQAFVRQQQKIEGARNLVNSTDQILDSSSNLYADKSKMGKRSQDGDRDLITRSVASAQVDKLLGTNVCAQEKFGRDEQGTLIGVSVQADGAGIRSQSGENEFLEQKTAFLAIDYSKPAVQRGLYDLEALDYVTGQIDRHQGNIFVDGKTGKVTGIDNDLAFPEMDREQMLQRNQGLMDKAVAGMPKMMHTETAQKIMAVTPDQLRESLQGVKNPDTGKGLGDAEIEGAVKRLTDLQTAIQNAPAGGIKVVPKFDDATYQESIQTQLDNNRVQAQGTDAGSTKQVKFNSTSYIGSVENERQFAQSRIDAGDSLYYKRDENSAGKAKLNQEYAAYTQLPPAQKDAYKNLQKDIEKLEDKLAENRRQIEKISGMEPSLKNNLANIRHGGVDGTLKHLMKKESEITSQLRDKMNAATTITAPVVAANIAKQNAASAPRQDAPKQGVPPIDQRTPLNSLPPPVAAQSNVQAPPPIDQRTPLSSLPPPVAAQRTVQAPPPMDQRVPLSSLPPPVSNASGATSVPESDSLKAFDKKAAKSKVPSKTAEEQMSSSSNDLSPPDDSISVDDGQSEQLGDDDSTTSISTDDEDNTVGLDDDLSDPAIITGGPSTTASTSSSHDTSPAERPRSASVGEMLKRSQSAPNLGALAQSQEAGGGNTIRNSGKWQPVKPSGTGTPLKNSMS